MGHPQSMVCALGRDAIMNWQTGLIAFVSAVLLFRYRVNSAWLILGAAAIGVIWQQMA